MTTFFNDFKSGTSPERNSASCMSKGLWKKPFYKKSKIVDYPKGQIQYCPRGRFVPSKILKWIKSSLLSKLKFYDICYSPNM